MKEYRWEERLGTYDTAILVLIVTDSLYHSLEAIDPDWLRGENEEAVNKYRGFALQEWPYQYLLLNNGKEYNGVNARTIAHESLHITTNVLNELGIPISKENDEAMTYLQDWIIGRVNAILAKHRIPISEFKHYMHKPAPKMLKTTFKP